MTATFAKAFRLLALSPEGLTATLAFIIALTAVAPARAAEKILFGMTSRTGFSAAHYVAEEKKLYAAENLDVETYAVGSAAGVLQQVAAGSLNIAQAATDQILRAMLQGVPLRIVGGAVAMPPFRLVASKGIKSWSELKGKTITVGGKSDVTLFFLRVMARKNGLADGDYDLIYGGGTPNRFAQLASGAVSAAILTNPQDFIALQQGYADLGSVSQYVPAWAQNNLIVDSRWSAKNAVSIAAFLRAWVRATRYYYDPANRAEVIEILAKYTKVAPDAATSTYDLFIKDSVISPDAELNHQGLDANLEALVTLGEIQAIPKIDGYIDLSFLNAAVSSLKK
jgi:NitT/TauT family transport system substrate-binding protein